MKIWIQTLIIALGLSTAAVAQSPTFQEVEISVSPLINGSLIRPVNQEMVPLVIIIQGSGPTDRNGNQPRATNNSLKYLAQGLEQNSIASFRFDKRIVPLLKNRTLDEASLSFNDFIGDAQAVLAYFKKSNAFSGYYIVGHSQGSLIGMVVAQNGADGYVSIAGAGQSIDNVIVDQLERQAPGLAQNARQAFDDLQVNGVAQNYSPGLGSIFRPAIQPFIRSWMQYDPQEEIAKLDIPVLLINGDNDLQVNQDEAQLLKDAKPDATLVIVETMNHPLKSVTGGDMENAKTLNEPQRPIHPELITTIVEFIKK